MLLELVVEKLQCAKQHGKKQYGELNNVEKRATRRMLFSRLWNDTAVDIHSIWKRGVRIPVK